MKIGFVINHKPLSINDAWRGGPRYRTKAYNTLKEVVAGTIFVDATLRNMELALPLDVTYHFYIRNYSRTDVANLEKPLTDALVDAGIYKDDRIIKRITLEKFEVLNTPEHVRIYIKPYE